MKNVPSKLALVALLGLAACEPDLPDSYQIVGGPPELAEFVHAAVDGWREAGLWDPVHSDAAGGARFMWVLNFAEVNDNDGAFASEDNLDVWINAADWEREISDGARITALRHEIGHFCIDDHIEASPLMMARLVNRIDAPAEAVDRFARQAFIDGCGL